MIHSYFLKYYLKSKSDKQIKQKKECVCVFWDRATTKKVQELNFV